MKERLGCLGYGTVLTDIDPAESVSPVLLALNRR